MGDAGHCERLNVSWALRRPKRRSREWDVAPLALVIVWRERNRGAFEGIEKGFANLRNSLFALNSF